MRRYSSSRNCFWFQSFAGATVLIVGVLIPTEISAEGTLTLLPSAKAGRGTQVTSGRFSDPTSASPATTSSTTSKQGESQILPETAGETGVAAPGSLSSLEQRASEEDRGMQKDRTASGGNRPSAGVAPKVKPVPVVRKVSTRPVTRGTGYFRANAYTAAAATAMASSGCPNGPDPMGCELPDNECYRYASPFGYSSRLNGGLPYYAQRPAYSISLIPGGFFGFRDPGEVCRWQDPCGGGHVPSGYTLGQPVIGPGVHPNPTPASVQP